MLLIIGMVLVVIAVIGLLIWKGPSLLHQQQVPSTTPDIGDYDLPAKKTPPPPQ